MWTEALDRFRLSIVIRGLFRARSASSSLRIMPIQSIVKASAPRSDTTASEHRRIHPLNQRDDGDDRRHRDDVAAQREQRSQLFTQIELRASRMDSKICDMTARGAPAGEAPPLTPLAGLGQPDEIAVEHVADRIEWPGDYAVAFIQAVRHRSSVRRQFLS